LTSHEQFADELVRYALGELAGTEGKAFAEHLEECPACRNELAEIQAGIAAFSLSSLGPAPPQRSRERLLKAVSAPKQRFSRMARPRWMLVPALASVFLATICILLVAENYRLRNQVFSTNKELVAANATTADLQKRLSHAQMVADTIMAPDSVQVTLVAAHGPRLPQGKVFYSIPKHAMVFVASNLSMPPSSMTYELWAIPATANAKPIPCGTFWPDSKGNYVMGMPMPPGVSIFAVTLEPAGGSEKPTSQPFIIGG
jgi:anti-sigma-K factor RskA